MLDPEAMAEITAAVVRQAVAEAVAPLIERLAALEARAPERGLQGERGETGAPGKNADLDVLRDLIRDEVATLPLAKDGTDGAPGADGKSVDLAEIRVMIDEAVSALPAPAAGQPGRNGADPDYERIGEMVSEEARKAFASIPIPKDGRDGADGIGLAGAFIDRSGALVVTTTDGRAHPLGEVVGKDGQDGADGAAGQDADPAVMRAAIAEEVSAHLPDAIERAVAAIPAPENGRDGADGAAGQDADPALMRSAIAEEVATHLPAAIERAVSAIPVPENGRDGADGRDGVDAYAGMARGLFDPHAEYRAMDVASLNGSEWRAKIDNPGPIPGDGWMLSAGRGKRGEKGDRGDAGRPGTAGKSIIAGYIDHRSESLIFAHDDGEEVKVDISDLMSSSDG